MSEREAKPMPELLSQAEREALNRVFEEWPMSGAPIRDAMEASWLAARGVYSPAEGQPSDELDNA